MTSLSCILTRPLALSHSLQNNNNHSSSSPPPQPNGTPQPRVGRITTNFPNPSKLRKIPQQKRPSVLEIERAIGTGMFKDRNPREEKEENTTMFDGLLPNPGGKNEGSVEKKLRETGEWMLDTTEGASRSAGQRILIGMFLLMIPTGISLLVASGAVKLPFSTPFLDELLM